MLKTRIYKRFCSKGMDIQKIGEPRICAFIANPDKPEEIVFLRWQQIQFARIREKLLAPEYWLSEYRRL